MDYNMQISTGKFQDIDMETKMDKDTDTVTNIDMVNLKQGFCKNIL